MQELIEGTPIQKIVCEKCGKISYMFHSRLDPKSWTEEYFKEIVDINEEKRTVSLKDKTKSWYDV